MSTITDPSTALTLTESIALALAVRLDLDADQAEALRRAAGYVLRARRDEGLPLTPQDAADRLRWAQELAMALDAALDTMRPAGVDVTLPAGAAAEIVRWWEEQAPLS